MVHRMTEAAMIHLRASSAGCVCSTCGSANLRPTSALGVASIRIAGQEEKRSVQPNIANTVRKPVGALHYRAFRPKLLLADRKIDRALKASPYNPRLPSKQSACIMTAASSGQSSSEA